jgi:hypothetical protein
MLDLDPIKDRLSAATPGTWHPVEFPAAKYVGVTAEHWDGSDMGYHVCSTEDCDPEDAVPNATFIAYAKTDVEFLVAEVERLRGHVKTADALRLEAAQEHGRERRHWADERHRFAEERIKLVSDYWRIREAVVRHRREAQAVNILVEPALADARLWAEVLE